MNRVLLALLICLSSFANDDNPYFYPVGKPTTSTVTETSFHKTFYQVIHAFYPELLNYRIPVVPTPEWEKGYMTAYTAQVNGVMKLGFWGGMARVPGMNDEAVALITCHEVGHLIGGDPYLSIPLEVYKDVSSEGQADYYATKTCLKEVWKNIKTESTDIPKELLAICEKEAVNSGQYNFCTKVLKGVHGFRFVMDLLKGDMGQVDYSGHDHEIVNQTIRDDYPSNQCRFDTFVAGLFDWDRPKCWFVND